jgi:hypothetical protein
MLTRSLFPTRTAKRFGTNSQVDGIVFEIGPVILQMEVDSLGNLHGSFASHFYQ